MPGSDRAMSHAQKRDLLVLAGEQTAAGGPVFVGASRTDGNARRSLMRAGLVALTVKRAPSGDVQTFAALTPAGWAAARVLGYRDQPAPAGAETGT